MPSKFDSQKHHRHSIRLPNHFHGILIFHEHVGATRPGLTNAVSGKVSLPNMTAEGIEGSPSPPGTKPASLGAIMAQFKSRVTKRLWKIPTLKSTPIWQRIMELALSLSKGTYYSQRTRFAKQNGLHRSQSHVVGRG